MRRARLAVARAPEAAIRAEIDLLERPAIAEAMPVKPMPAMGAGIIGGQCRLPEVKPTTSARVEPYHL